MIPILYERNETEFTSNGLCRLRDCLSFVVTEERNGIYEASFDYPVDGANYDMIQCGRIVAAIHDDSGDVQPFDIVSYTKPISGVVTFHAVHVSYRLNYIVARGTGVVNVDSAFTMLKDSGQPENPFTYSADFLSTAYMASADGTPRSVRQFLGGVEGSILDTYGGEYGFDRFSVKLYAHRGIDRNFTIRYGVNLLSYSDEVDYQETYSSCIPFWSSNGDKVIGNRVDLSTATYNGRNNCIPLDLTEKFEGKPSTSDLQTMALSHMQSRQSQLPTQTIKVDFVRLRDMGEFADYQDLLECNLCDTIGVVFPLYGMSGRFKIVKAEYNVLSERYVSMELGALSTSLAEALGITTTLSDGSGGGGGGGDFTDITERFTLDGAWTQIYKEAHISNGIVSYAIEAQTNTYVANYRYALATIAEGYRPRYTTFGTGYTTDANYNPKAVVSVNADAGGGLAVRAANTNGNYFFVSGWYKIG